MHLEKFILVDTHNTATLVGNNLHKRIDKVAKEKKLLPLMIEEDIVKIKVEPCQHYEWNAYIGSVAK